jgi:protein ImuB
MDDELRAALEALGLRTVGALAALSAEEVERRWGELGRRAWRLARADDPRRPVLARVETQPAIEVTLPSPAATTEPVLFLVHAALDRLVNEMIAHGRAVAAIAITLTLDDARGPFGTAPAHTVTREARPARPLARVQPLFERCRALLDGWPLDAPVSAVRVAIVAAAPLTGEQGDLLSASWRDIGAADAALERLRAELGADAIVRADARDTHRPERAGVWRELAADGLSVARAVDPSVRPLRPAQVDSQVSRQVSRQAGSRATERPTAQGADRPVLRLAEPAPAPVAATMAYRAFDPPEAVEVSCQGDTPNVVTWRGQQIAVTRAVGPERLSGDWWDDGYRRDYWRCESLMGEMTVFLDRLDDGWRLQGWGD